MHHNEHKTDIDVDEKYYQRTHRIGNMESPNEDTPSFNSFLNKFQARNLSNDSGYTTFTHSSAELSILNAESSNLSLGCSFPIISTPHNSAAYKREAYKNTQAFKCDTNLSKDIASIRLQDDFCEIMETDSFDLATPIPRHDFLQSSEYGKSDISDILHRTPKKSTRKDLKKNSIRSTDRKTIKKHSYRPCDYMQKIGTPEKNQLLYSNIKPVTPRRKSKTPERVLTNCKKVLFFDGVEKVDFLKWLEIYSVVGVVLSNLEDQDLLNVYNVSKAWRNACINNPIAKKRLLKYKRILKEEFEINKENHDSMMIKENNKEKNEEKNDGIIRGKHMQLMEIHNICNVLPQNKNTIPKSPPVSPSKRKHRKFVKAASQGHDISKCIKCGNPALVENNWASCQSPGCMIIYCNICHYDKENCDKLGCKLLKTETSPIKENPRPKSLKSNRKGLRRLLL